MVEIQLIVSNAGYPAVAFSIIWHNIFNVSGYFFLNRFSQRQTLSLVFFMTNLLYV